MPKIRLSKIYTRTGDDGTTGVTGERLAKTHPLIQAIGDIDEANSIVGLARTENLPAEIDEILERLQHDLFNLGGELSLNRNSDIHLITADHATAMEKTMDKLLVNLPPLKEFILPGGSKAAAFLHMARAVCRRAERTLWALNAISPISTPLLLYMNRSSDLLFLLAREINRCLGVADVLWKSKGK